MGENTPREIPDVGNALEHIRGGTDDARSHMRMLMAHVPALRSAVDADPMAIVLHVATVGFYSKDNRSGLTDRQMAEVGEAILFVRPEDEFREIVELGLSAEALLRMAVGMEDLPSSVLLAISKDDVIDAIQRVVNSEFQEIGSYDGDGVGQGRGAGHVLYLQILGHNLADRDDWDEILDMTIDRARGLTLRDWMIIAAWYELDCPRVEKVGEMGYSEGLSPDVFDAVGIDVDIASARIVEMKESGEMPEIDPYAIRQAREARETSIRDAAAVRKAQEAIDDAVDSADI